ncbi:MSMEG_0567/sll0787 family protein [Streptomyces sp. GQFP]|uniref:MSMEG_0567/sll0787 family protein n=1 Tax=Streptomyces sp. GQFP TaxID=2907545 RepID=UPI001F22F0F6|nr:MSMEG_0567/sll0787 family protein [Streptomyces sp. GQFP]UIX28645.1 GNAT family N-acetyltransferase [Streptomyces sp. GQFP]
MSAVYLDGSVVVPAGDVPQDILALLGDRSTLARMLPAFRVEEADGTADLVAYRRLRRDAFVHEQGLFAHHDLDDRDSDPRTVVLVARDPEGTVVGGVRLGPVADGPDIGWWAGGRLVVARGARGPHGIGAALVRAACARAETEGVLRFDATVQARNEVLFRRLGWRRMRPTTVADTPHVLMRWPINRITNLVTTTKAPLGHLLTVLPGQAGPDTRPERGAGNCATSPHRVAVNELPGGPGDAGILGGPGFIGDDGAPVPGTDLIAACDAIVPSMVERDPEWAGWCAVLVNVNDLAAMGASPVGLLDAVGAKDVAHARQILAGLARAAQTYGVPVLGGHTQLGVPAALSVTALGRTRHPVPGGGGRPGHAVRLTADLGGNWRPGYRGRQWDSSSHRRTDELRAMTGAVAAARPAAAKDVSMAGIAGTLGMLAEASGCGAVLDVAAVPRPGTATTGDWLTCFPGFAMLTTDEPGAPPLPAGPATGAVCGELTDGQGVGLRWPDGEITEAVTSTVTGMGTA